jgi:magnesium-transporting ATPase (P-type)
MQILWINILMDGPPAQSLGVEPVDPAVMSRPPRQRDALILTRRVIKRVLTQATVILLGTMCVYVLEMNDGKVTARDTTMVQPPPTFILPPQKETSAFSPSLGVLTLGRVCRLSRRSCFSICLTH